MPGPFNNFGARVFDADKSRLNYLDLAVQSVCLLCYQLGLEAN